MYFKDMMAKLHQPGARPKVINLWATWCRPCVAELPHFEAYALAHKDKVDMYFVSLDFVQDQDTRLPAVLNAKKITTPVIALQDTDPNDWIPLLQPSWEGAIPATYIIGTDGKVAAFHPAGLTAEELEKFIAPYIQN